METISDWPGGNWLVVCVLPNHLFNRTDNNFQFLLSLAIHSDIIRIRAWNENDKNLVLAGIMNEIRGGILRMPWAQALKIITRWCN